MTEERKSSDGRRDRRPDGEIAGWAGEEAEAGGGSEREGNPRFFVSLAGSLCFCRLPFTEHNIFFLKDEGQRVGLAIERLCPISTLLAAGTLMLRVGSG